MSETNNKISTYEDLLVAINKNRHAYQDLIDRAFDLYNPFRYNSETLAAIDFLFCEVMQSWEDVTYAAEDLDLENSEEFGIKYTLAVYMEFVNEAISIIANRPRSRLKSFLVFPIFWMHQKFSRILFAL